MEQKKSIGIWIRVSTEDQAKGESPEHHEKRARLYAESKGWEVAVVYRLEALSGKSVMSYPQTKQMLKDVREKRITGLIFSKLARLARNTKELLELADIFKLEDCDLISLHEAIDTSTPSGRLFYTMIAAMAQWEREEIVDRITASVPIRAKMGKKLNGQLSLGYKYNGNEVVIDEKFAPLRKLVFDMFLTHRRKRTVARILNEQGYRTRTGHKFCDTSVKRLLRDPMAKGERRVNFTKSVGKTKSWVLKPVSEWVISSCPAIVSAEVWDECNRLLDESEKKNKRLGPKTKHLLAGFVECAVCENKMYVFHQTKNPTYRCQKCKTSIPTADIDVIFHEQLKTFLLTETPASEYLESISTALQEKQLLLAGVLEERAIIKKKMDRLIELRINGEMSKEQLAEHYKPLEERIVQINDQLPELQAEIDFLTVQHRSSDVVLQDAKDLYSQWNTLEFEHKRTIVETITERIAIAQEDVYLKLAYLPSHVPSQPNSVKKHPSH